jgi:hypothetical protein
MSALLTFLFVFLNSIAPNIHNNNGGISNPKNNPTSSAAKIGDETGG